MKKLMILLMVAGSSPVVAQTRASATAVPAAGVCAALASTYDGASKELATNSAEGIGDNSAPRATLRALEDSNTLAEAKMTLDLMRDHHCPMPKSAPARIFYLLPALTCANDRMKASGSVSPASCDQQTWQRAGQSAK